MDCIESLAAKFNLPAGFVRAYSLMPNSIYTLLKLNINFPDETEEVDMAFGPESLQQPEEVGDELLYYDSNEGTLAGPE